MNTTSPSLSLPQALQRIRRHVAQGEWQTAEALCQQLLELLPEGLLPVAGAAWVSVLRSAERHADACRALYQYLLRQPWGRDADEIPTAPVLLVCGMESVLRGHVQFSSAPWESLDFQLLCGHFDPACMLQLNGIQVDRLFIHGAMDIDQRANIQRRLSHYQLIINTIADPSSESGALEMACELLARHPDVINPPLLVQQSERDVVAACLRDLPGLQVPLLERIEVPDAGNRAALHTRLQNSRSGLIIRPLDEQTGPDMQRILDPVALDAWLDLRPNEGLLAIDYHDCRHHGLYRRFRMFAINGQLYPAQLISSRNWNIHDEDRHPLMDEHPALQQAEREFLENPRALLGWRGTAALLELAERIPLDYLAIDFTLLPGGDLLLFKATPASSLNLQDASGFSYLQPATQAIARAFCTMIRQRMQPKTQVRTHT